MYRIEQRRGGQWTTEGIGEPEGFPTIAEAEEAIESLADLSTRENGYEWDGLYRVVDEDTGEVVSELRVGDLVTIRVDEENNAEAWWDAARDAIGGDPEHAAPFSARERDHYRCPDSCRPLLSIDGPRGVEVTRGDALAFEAWASRLPGWAGGPAYAPHPVLIEWPEEVVPVTYVIVMTDEGVGGWDYLPAEEVWGARLASPESRRFSDRAEAEAALEELRGQWARFLAEEQARGGADAEDIPSFGIEEGGE